VTGAVDEGPLARDLLRLRGVQLDERPLEEAVAYDRAATAAAEARVTAGARGPGELFPPVELPRPTERACIVSWYLSSTSPFCRATLSAFAAAARSDRAIGEEAARARVSVLFLTPEPAGRIAAVRRELDLPFEVRHDGGSAAEALGICYEAPGEFASILSLQEHRLPLTATYLVDSERRILDCFLHPDARFRAEPAALIAAADAMADGTAGGTAGGAAG
jgi:hypothetical protein